MHAYILPQTHASPRISALPETKDLYLLIAIFIRKKTGYTPALISRGDSSFSKGVEMAVMVRVTEGTSPGGCSSVIGSVLMVAEGKSADRYHFSLSTSSVGKGQATHERIWAAGVNETQDH